MTEPARSRGARVGRYQLGEELAAGGMATVHLARALGPLGISRIVAVKRMHAHVANDPTARRMFLDEARLAYRISHPNVVGTLDVVEHEAEVLIVLEYVAGETLAELQKSMLASGERLPISILSAIVEGALRGLHAAHEALDEHGTPVQVVHRDVSPQNLIVGVDGVTRVLDFGIAKAQGRLQETTGIVVRGKLRYLSPEQIRRAPVDRRADLFATGVVLWEALVGRRLFEADDIAGLLDAVLHGDIPAPHQLAAAVPEALSELVLRALSRDPEGRPATAWAFAEELVGIVPPATALEVAALVKRCAAPELARREALVARLVSARDTPTPSGSRSAAQRPEATFDPDGTEPDVAGPTASPAFEPALTPAVASSRRPALLTARPLVVLLALAGGAFAIAFMQKDAPPAQTLVPTATSDATKGVPLLAAPPVSSGSAAPLSEATTRAPAAKAAAPAAPRKATVPGPQQSARPRAAPGSDCEFPFSIGEDGVRIPKKACFGP